MRKRLVSQGMGLALGVIVSLRFVPQLFPESAGRAVIRVAVMGALLVGQALVAGLFLSAGGRGSSGLGCLIGGRPIED